MVFVYLELFALLLVSFVAGSGASLLLLRLAVRRRAEEITAYVADAVTDGLPEGGGAR